MVCAIFFKSWKQNLRHQQCLLLSCFLNPGGTGSPGAAGAAQTLPSWSFRKTDITSGPTTATCHGGDPHFLAFLPRRCCKSPQTSEGPAGTYKLPRQNGLP